MNDRRPDADELLQRIQEQGHRESRARFKIFFGASAGVGKTFAMLLEARERRETGADVVAGVIETHGRSETARLVEGLERLPLHAIEYRGAALEEFDLDAALARRPQLLLVDELAHTNAPGSRHAKRWQDVEELLSAGIEVYATLNVQHVDSLNDVVAQVTGVTVRETVPDSILDRADEIELIDLPPEDLIQRLREGKVYIPHQAERALQSFFTKGNLIALRELALRKTAERVDAQLESHRRLEGISKTWDVRERLLVCVGNPDAGLALVREARRMAAGLRADWLVAHIERPGELRGDPAAHGRLVDLLGFAEELGAQTAILSGHRVSDELIDFARSRHVSRILVGKPTRSRWVGALLGSLTDTLIRSSPDIDVYMVDTRRAPRDAKAAAAGLSGPRSPLRNYVSAIAIVAVATGIAALMFPHFDRANLIMVYLIGVLLAAVRFGRGPGALASVLSVAAFDFFFVPPTFTFAVTDTQYLVTFATMLGSALLVSTLAVRLREQAEEARRRERRTAALYALSRDLADAPTTVDLQEAAMARVRETFDCDAALLLPDSRARISPRTALRSGQGIDGREIGVAQWAFDHRQPAGAGTATLPSATGLYWPLETQQGAVGVLAIVAPADRLLARGDQVRLLETFTHQIALALERAELAAESERSRMLAESERLRNALLSSVSHDLRTPLAAITGATSTLIEQDARLSEPVRRDLLQGIASEAQRMNRLVANLLEMTRLESEGVQVRKDWHSIEELVGTALARLEPALAGRAVALEIPADLPLVPLDAISIEQVLLNLIENAIKYSPPSSPITIRAAVENGLMVVEVLDRGRGIALGEEARVFEKFYRVKWDRDPGGIGLGLAICRAIVTAHGGTISAHARDGGGAVVRFALPIVGAAPPAPDPDLTSGEAAS
jgi:two-component system, OmpR family, sensor histidine kinase KdpD